jgi:hypothetical protein
VYDSGCEVTNLSFGLAVGTNLVTVWSSNIWGVLTNDTTYVWRGPVGTGTPFVDITNSYPQTLSYETTSIALAGTNNMQVAGGMWWTNITSGSSGGVTRSPGTLTWSCSASYCAHGTNTILVRGTNLWHSYASTTAYVYRLTYADAVPHIETNALVFPCAGAMLWEMDMTNITWDVSLITDRQDGTNLVISDISLYDAITTSHVHSITGDFSSLQQQVVWQLPPDTTGGVTNYFLRFEVVDSSSLTNSRIFIDNPFTIVPEPIFIGLFIFIISIIVRQGMN